MLARAPLSLAVALAAACTPRAFTPNARTLAIDSPETPGLGHADLQGDLGLAGAPFGPDATDGGLRYRRTVREGMTVEGEGRVLYLTTEDDEQKNTASRSAVTGRVGLMLQPAKDDAVRSALTIGVGGGHSATAGQWASVDLGGVIGGGHRLFRPFIGGDVSYNAAVGSKRFDVVDTDDDSAVTLELPNTVGLRATAGLELGPPDAAAVVGFSLARMIGLEPDVVGSTDKDDEVVVALGLGFRLALDR